jgi:hypothetical protein
MIGFLVDLSQMKRAGFASPRESINDLRSRYDDLTKHRFEIAGTKTFFFCPFFSTVF